MLHGLNDLLKNLDKAGDDILKTAGSGIGKAAMSTASHIKKEFRRNVTGKGFDNVTGLLRASIGSKVVFTTKAYAIGYVYAGTHYAPYVEFRWNGKYAYLWPGLIEMKSEILKILTKELRGTLK